MVQIKTIDRLYEQSKEIARDAGTNPEVARRVMEAIKERIKRNHRRPREPVPEGGISIRAAARKYDVSKSKISYWVKRGYINILKITMNWTYIDEKQLIEYLKIKEIINP